MEGPIDYDSFAYTLATFALIVIARFLYRAIRDHRRRREWNEEMRRLHDPQWWRRQ